MALLEQDGWEKMCVQRVQYSGTEVSPRSRGLEDGMEVARRPRLEQKE